MRRAAIACILSVSLFGANAFAQNASVHREARQTRIEVSGWTVDTFACTLAWRENGELRTDTRRMPDGASYTIAAAPDATVESISCTPDTPPGVTSTPAGCRELVRPAYNGVAAEGAARQFREQNAGQSMIFRIALTPDAQGAPTDISVMAQRASDPLLLDQWGVQVSDQLAAVAAQSRFTAECAGARIMLPFTLR